MKKLKYLLVAVFAVAVLMLAGCDNEEKIELSSDDMANIRDNYIYNQLSPEEQKVYEEMYYILTRREESLKIDTLDSSEIEELFSVVLRDCPEIFWVDSYRMVTVTVGNDVDYYRFQPLYTMSRSEIETTQAKLENAIAEYDEAVSGCTDDYETAKKVYEEIVKNVNYDLESSDNQNIISVFLNKSSICQGYAKAYQFLMNRYGIECATIKGKGENALHAWNMIKLDGDYYYVDVTWGRTNFGDYERMPDYVNYNYFAITSDELLINHEFDDCIDYPECTATKDNYYVREGLYFNDWDAQKVYDSISSSAAAGKKIIAVKFSSKEFYDAMFDLLVTQNQLLKLCGKGKVAFYEAPEYKVFTAFII